MRFTVDIWGSHPDEGNDDCWSGNDYDDEAEARKAFSDVESVFNWVGHTNWHYVELCRCVGEDSWEQIDLRRNPNFTPEEDHSDNEWAMLQGMAHGCEAYNEAIGSPLGREEV